MRSVCPAVQETYKLQHSSTCIFHIHGFDYQLIVPTCICLFTPKRPSFVATTVGCDAPTAMMAPCPIHIPKPPVRPIPLPQKLLHRMLSASWASQHPPAWGDSIDVSNMVCMPQAFRPGLGVDGGSHESEGCVSCGEALGSFLRTTKNFIHPFLRICVNRM